ncbi:MAG: Mov34/MPN/PAD-1 family protein [Streptococcus agalactiae]
MICLFHRKKILKSQFDLLLEIPDIKKKIQQAQKGGSFFLGTWHTHPQDFVSPSFIDISDWKESIKKEKPAADFMVFVIVGRQEIGVWVGDNEQKKIMRIREKL